MNRNKNFCIISTSLFLIFFLSACSSTKRYTRSSIKTTTFSKKQVQKSYMGITSWYGKKFHGKKTASGEKFDMHRLTAAHKKLPFGTKIRVTNPKNKKSVIVRINDRGPFVKNVEIDISYKAAKLLNIVQKGKAKVLIEIL